MKIQHLGLALLASTTFAFSAQADTDAQKEQALLDKTAISLVAAIQSAEAHVNGVATSADLESEKGAAVFEVDVLAEGRLYEVKVNSQDASIINVTEDLD